MKTNKSFKKRIKVSKNGKLITRGPGGNHFNAKEPRSKQMRRKRAKLINMKKKTINRFLSGSSK